MKTRLATSGVILIVLLWANCGFAQDTLVYRDGRVFLVSEIVPDSAAGVLHCVKYGVPAAIPLSEIAKFSIGPAWYSVNQQGAIIGPYMESGYRLGQTILQRPAEQDAKRFSVSINLASPFVSTWTPDYSYYKYDSGHPEYPVESYVSTDWSDRAKMQSTFATNRTFSIAPGMNLSPRWEVRVPIMIGIPGKFQKNITQSEAIWSNFNYSYDQSISYVRSPFATYAMPGFEDYSISGVSVDPSGLEGWSSSSHRHAKNVLFQVGIAPRFYPMGINLKRALYLSQSFNLGVGDAYAMDVYASFDTTTYSKDWYAEYDYWILYEEKIEIRRSPFVYFRYEALAGIDFLSKTGWFLSLEAGITTRFQNQGEADRFFVKIPGSSTYAFLTTHVFEFDTGVQPIARINLGFRFHEIH